MVHRQRGQGGVTYGSPICATITATCLGVNNL
nr:MAG TPA: hypothetical protein [Caudoviricetes sp.]